MLNIIPRTGRSPEANNSSIYFLSCKSIPAWWNPIPLITKSKIENYFNYKMALQNQVGYFIMNLKEKKTYKNQKKIGVCPIMTILYLENHKSILHKDNIIWKIKKENHQYWFKNKHSIYKNRIGLYLHFGDSCFYCWF